MGNNFLFDRHLNLNARLLKSVLKLQLDIFFNRFGRIPQLNRNGLRIITDLCHPSAHIVRIHPGIRHGTQYLQYFFSLSHFFVLRFQILVVLCEFSCLSSRAIREFHVALLKY